METIKIYSHADIMRSTSIKIAEGLMPHRLVLRKNGNEFITHMENLTPKQNGNVLEFHHRDFYWGHYFQKEADAVANFEERSKK